MRANESSLWWRGRSSARRIVAKAATTPIILLDLMIRAAIDWGSSRFRAYRLNDAFDIVDSRDSATGIKYVAEKSFFSYT